MAAGTIWMFGWALEREGPDYARSVAFLSMALFQLWNVFNMRSSELSIRRLGPFTNRWALSAVAGSVGLIALVLYVPLFQAVFRTVPLGASVWLYTAGLSFLVVPFVELWKVLVRRGVIPREWV
jgi:Ca2+-transporting ATPase